MTFSPYHGPGAPPAYWSPPPATVGWLPFNQLQERVTELERQVAELREELQLVVKAMRAERKPVVR